MIVCPRINTFFTFFPSVFFNLLVSMATFVEILVAKYILSLVAGTKIVAAWNTAMFWEVVSHPCKCKLQLKLRLDAVLGDSSAPLSVLANIFSWCWFENLEQLSSTYLERSQLKDLKYHLNGLLSDNLKKFSV